MKIRVYYDDTDAGGVVYHANYLKFCERARSELFFQHGKTPVLEGGHFVVKHIEADFIRSAKLGDLLEIKTELITLKNASLHVKQTIYQADELFFSIKCQLAFVKDQKICKIDPLTKDFFTKVLAQKSVEQA